MHILHCDISAGNVLLTETQDGPLRGFITDVECAHIESTMLLQPRMTVTTTFPIQTQFNSREEPLANRTNSTIRTHTWFESEVEIKRGACMTVSVIDTECFVFTPKDFQGNRPIYGQSLIDSPQS